MTQARHPRANTYLDRLTPLDTSNLRVEDHGVPMHVAALAFVDGASATDGHLR